MLRARLVLAVCCFTTLLLAAACGDDPSPGPSGFVDPDTDRPEIGPDAGDTSDEGSGATCDITITAPGGPAIAVATGASTSLVVLVEDCNRVPVAAGTTVTFTVQGETGGAALLARNAFTDEGGVATAPLNAGSEPATFDVLVETAGAAPLTLHLTVGATASGTISVTITVVGPITFDSFAPYLYAGRTCANLGPYDRPVALLEGASVASPSAHPRFTSVAVGTAYAVIVLADKDLGLRGYGCTDALEVRGGQETEAVVAVGEIPIVFTGVYALDNTFDMSDALPPSVATTLQIFDEMTDDDDLEGNPATEDYGVDPAAFLLDFVYRELCCWEATGSSPTWSSCRAQTFQHPWGDLEQLYTEIFFSWDGAQPRETGLCTGIYFGNEVVMALVQGFIDDNAPGVVLDLLQMAGDLSRAFTDMHITSELTVAEAYLTKNSNFTHELRTMIVELHDLDGELHVFEFALTQAGLTNLSYTGETSVSEGHVLVIPAHSFRLDFGRLLLYVYRNGVLPLLDCDPDHDGFTEPCESTGDLFKTWIDCDEVGVWLEENVSNWISADTYAGFCDTGIDIAGIYFEGEIAGSVDRETVITLSGSAQAGELDARRRALELLGGAWDGLLVEDEVEIGTFDGVFTGERTGDVP